MSKSSTPSGAHFHNVYGNMHSYFPRTRRAKKARLQRGNEGQESNPSQKGKKAQDRPAHLLLAGSVQETVRAMPLSAFAGKVPGWKDEAVQALLRFPGLYQRVVPIRALDRRRGRRGLQAKRVSVAQRRTVSSVDVL